MADLIDNCRDISRHDERFAMVYLEEMRALLEVLTKADEGLMRRARRTMAEGIAYIDKSRLEEKDTGEGTSEETDAELHFKRQYNDLFMAKDIAESLLSFDAKTPVSEVIESLGKHQRHLVTVRADGEVIGFIILE